MIMRTTNENENGAGNDSAVRTKPVSPLELRTALKHLTVNANTVTFVAQAVKQVFGDGGKDLFLPWSGTNTCAWDNATPSMAATVTVVNEARKQGYNGEAVEAIQASCKDSKEKWCIMDAVEEFKTRMTPIVTCNTLWHSQDHRGVWQVTERADYAGLAQSCCPYENRNARNTDLLLDTFANECQVPPGRLKKACIWEDDSQQAVIVNCRNGLLRVTVDRVELMPYDWRKEWFSGQLLAAYDPGAECDVFDVVFLEAQPLETNREILRWWFGYCLYPDLRYRVALINYGPTTTGKTTIWYYGIRNVFGKDLSKSLSLADLCDEKGYSIPRLHNALLNIGGELDADELTRSSRFKQIIGGESLEARSPYGKPFTMADYMAKLVFCSNHLPRFKSGGDAELKRLKFVPWTVRPRKEEPSLQLRITKEIDGIFTHRMVPSLQRLIGGWAPPDEADDAAEIREDFALVNDPATMFVNKCCELGKDKDGKDFEEDKDVLLKGFRLFVRETDLSSSLEHKSVFGRLLLKAFPGKVKSSRPWNIGERERVYRGIRLTPDWAAKIKSQMKYDDLDDEPWRRPHNR